MQVFNASSHTSALKTMLLARSSKEGCVTPSGPSIIWSTSISAALCPGATIDGSARQLWHPCKLSAIAANNARAAARQRVPGLCRASCCCSVQGVAVQRASSAAANCARLNSLFLILGRATIPPAIEGY